MKIREIARGLQFPEGPIAMDDGSVLLVEIARGTLTRVTPDGRVSVVADLGGGPNGAAIGPDGALHILMAEIPEDRRADLEQACENCPTQALSIQ